MSTMNRNIPVAFLLREDVAWLTANRPHLSEDSLSGSAKFLLETLQNRGAMFAADLAQAAELLPAQLPDLLGELVARGRITADGFSGLRQLIDGNAPTPRRYSRMQIARQRQSQSVGRWAVWEIADHPEEAERDPAEITEEWAWQLLRRWGVMFRDLLAREPGAPRWFELLQIYRRLEARGEIRGGRFITGVAGEQFALGETVKQLRQLRDQEPAEEYLVISAADPLNLVGILTPHARVPATANNRVLFQNGVPLAWRRSQTIEQFESLEPPTPLMVSLLNGRLGCHLPQAKPPEPKPDEVGKKRVLTNGRLF